MKPPGTECKLYFHTDETVAVGHYIVSSGGSGYLVKAARESKRTAGRFNLVCLRCNPKDIPAGSIIHPLFWFKRESKKARSTI